MKTVVASFFGALYLVVFVVYTKAPTAWLLFSLLLPRPSFGDGVPPLLASLSDLIPTKTQQQEDGGNGYTSSSQVASNDLFQKAATAKGVSPDMLAAIVTIESNGNSRAVSPSGAKGIAQIMPIFQEQFCPAADLFDTKQNLECSAAGLAWLSDYFNGDEDKIVMAYHGGASRIMTGNARPIDYEYLRRYKSVKGYNSNASIVQLVEDNYDTSPALPRAASSFSNAQPTTVREMANNLYGDTNWRVTQGAHATYGLGNSAYDLGYACGVTLHAPINGTVTHNGDDGMGIGNTMLSIRGDGGTVHMLHGNYDIPYGATVKIGDVVGSEASNGNSSGCHTHFVHSYLTMQ